MKSETRIVSLSTGKDGALEPVLLRPVEVARMLGLGRSTIFNAIGAGELRCVRFGRAVRVPREAVEEWIRAKASAA